MHDDLKLDEFSIGVGDADSRHELPLDPSNDMLSAEVAALSLLVRSCLFAENHFGLRVAECDAPGAPSRWGPVHRVHAPGSYHYSHRAADISGTEQAMRRFCAWALRTHLRDMAELIHNPGASVKGGRQVPSSFWGTETWAAHRNHVHLAI
jgi:hypothetical protein